MLAVVQHDQHVKRGQRIEHGLQYGLAGWPAIAIASDMADATESGSETAASSTSQTPVSGPV